MVEVARGVWDEIEGLGDEAGNGYAGKDRQERY